MASQLHMMGGQVSPGHDGEHGVLPLIEDLVVVAVADAHLRDLDADIIGARGAPGELEGHQHALVVMCSNANCLATYILSHRWVRTIVAVFFHLPESSAIFRSPKALSGISLVA